MRKRTVLFGVMLLLLLPIAAMGAVPTTMNYQGYLTDAAGVPVNGTRDIHFSLNSTATGGTTIWSEAHPDITVTKGVYTVVSGL